MPNRAAAPLGPATTQLACLRAAKICFHSAWSFVAADHPAAPIEREISGSTKSPVGGTVAETTAAVTEAGGRGIAVAVDHADDAAVAALFAQIANEHGRLDISRQQRRQACRDNGPRFVLAKAVGLEGADMLLVGLRSHFVASYYAAPLLIANGRRLIVNTGHYGAVSTWQKSFVRIV